MREYNHLPKGYRLQEYKIERVLGQGGFGITYLARDVNLQKQIVIKEFFPKEYSSRDGSTYSVLPDKNRDEDKYGYFLKKFINEARILASIEHPNIVKVTRFFEENNTGYFLMDYIQGESLKHYINRKGSLDESEILSIIIPILEGLKEVHAKDFLHRDIAPDNIYITQNGMPMLIDFGAAKNVVAKESKSIAGVFKAGYSSPEQYILSAKHTKATDIYSVGAVIVAMIIGETPPESTQRQYDEIDPLEIKLEQYQNRYSSHFLNTVQKAVSLKAKDRFQRVVDFQKALLQETSNPIDPISNLTPKSKQIVKLIIVSLISVGILGVLFIQKENIISFIEKNKREQINNLQNSQEQNNSDLKQLSELSKQISDILNEEINITRHNNDRAKEKRNKIKHSKQRWNPLIYRGKRSYSKNSENTIKDNYTGLIWQKSGSDKDMSFKEAKKYCTDLTLDKYSDWRLPSQIELYYLANRNRYKPAIDSEYFNLKNLYYWSSTPYKPPIKDNSFNVWIVSFEHGNDFFDSELHMRYVLCVRGE